jgi:murein L,D-transpeptidase YcbB/YkuD
MEEVFESTNMFRAFMFTTSKVLKRGDMVIKDGHVVMVLEGVVETVNVAVEVLKKGVKSNSVKTLQILLNGYGYSCGEADGSFGPKTLAAVKEFQRAKGLTVDGIVGIATWTALLD